MNSPFTTPQSRFGNFNEQNDNSWTYTRFLSFLIIMAIVGSVLGYIATLVIDVDCPSYATFTNGYYTEIKEVDSGFFIRNPFIRVTVYPKQALICEMKDIAIHDKGHALSLHTLATYRVIPTQFTRKESIDTYIQSAVADAVNEVYYKNDSSTPIFKSVLPIYVRDIAKQDSALVSSGIEIQNISIHENHK